MVLRCAVLNIGRSPGAGTSGWLSDRGYGGAGTAGVPGDGRAGRRGAGVDGAAVVGAVAGRAEGPGAAVDVAGLPRACPPLSDSVAGQVSVGTAAHSAGVGGVPDRCVGSDAFGSPARVVHFGACSGDVAVDDGRGGEAGLIEVNPQRGSGCPSRWGAVGGVDGDPGGRVAGDGYGWWWRCGHGSTWRRSSATCATTRCSCCGGWSRSPGCAGARSRRCGGTTSTLTLRR